MGLFRTAPLPGAILAVIPVVPLAAVRNSEASAERSVAPRKCILSAAGDSPCLRRWLVRFDPKKIVEKTALPYSLAGLPSHLCAPRRVSAGTPLFLPHSALRRRPCARGWPRWQLGTGQPSELPARPFQSGRRQKLRLPSRRALGRAAWPGLTLELEGCRGLLHQFASAWTPCRPFSLTKESLLNTDIIQNKNLFFFLFCFSEYEQQGM